MGKRKQEEAEPKSQKDAAPSPPEIFNYARVNNTAVSPISIRRKLLKLNPKKNQNPDSVLLPKEQYEEEEEAGANSAGTKRSKKSMTRQSYVVNHGLHEEEEEEDKEEKQKSGDVTRKQEFSECDSKSEKSSDLDNKERKKRKRGEIEKEYEEKKYGFASEEGEDEEKKKVGDKRKKLDDSAELMVSKEGFDDENTLLRTLFVGNLPLKVKKKTILKEFSRFGEIESVKIRSVPIIDTDKTGKGAIMPKQMNENDSSVHAFVVFKTEQSVDVSLAHNMSLIDCNHIRVDRACPPRKKLKGQNAQLYDPHRTVFASDLPFDVTDEEIYQLFTSVSNLKNTIEGIRVVRDSRVDAGKSIAYVLFKTREAANLVIRERSLKLRERVLRFSQTISDSTSSKRKNPSSTSNPNPPAKKPATGEINLLGAEDKNPLKQKSCESAKAEPRDKIKQEKRTAERKRKGPSVDAGTAEASKESGMKQAGHKRKPDSMSPETLPQNKKLRPD